MTNGPPLTDAGIERLREQMRAQQVDITNFLERRGVDVSPWENHPND